MVSSIGENGSWKEDYLLGDYRTAYNDYYIDEEYTFVKSVADAAAAESPEDYKSIATLMGFGENETNVNDKYVSLFDNLNIESREEVSKAAARETNVQEFYKKGWNYDRYFSIYGIKHLETETLISEIEANTFNETCILRTYGAFKSGDSNSAYVTDDSHDFFSSLELGYYHIPHFDEGEYSDFMNGKYLETAAFLMSLNKSGSNFKLLRDIESSKKSFSRVPKFVLLQCGAVLALHYAYNGNFNRPIDRNFTSEHLNCNDEDITAFLNNMSTLGKYTVLNYFIKWANKWHSKIFENLRYEVTLGDGKRMDDAVFNFHNDRCYYHVLTSENDMSVSIGLLNVENDFVKSITSDLFSCVSLTCGSVAHYQYLKDEHVIRDEGYGEFSVSHGIIFLDEFFKKVREAFYKPNEEREQTKIADDPKNTTDDMRSELYRYLKQVYDKWLPSSTEEEWKFEKFFDETKNTEGRTFRFIDSYYNKIGQKLLVNPQKVVDMIGSSLSNSEVNYMLFNFLADVYSQSKCMLMCVQNFIDLSETDSMKKMFQPIAYNDIRDVKKHPDFVVIYPYEPSKHLDINNSNYEDDAFMLNNEMETPIAIRSRGEGEGTRWYKIPAFGVSYGRQYQSVFKNVNVSMANAVMTEQAILAKHAILRGATDTNTKGVASQDLYSIYTNQSYTCRVEMMGCMWVQPMMYMVLLNIPMFRGSYMIMSVKHSMAPGNMTTEITAVRMANVSNKIVQDIFTEEFAREDTPKIPETPSGEYDKPKSECEYEKFPLFGSDGSADFTSELNRKVTRDDCFSEVEYNVLKNNTILEALSKIAANEGGTSVPLQYMLVATVLYNRRRRYGGYKKYIFRHPQFDIKRLTGVTPTSDVTNAVREIFTKSPAWILSAYHDLPNAPSGDPYTTVKNTGLVSYSDSKYFKKGAKIVGSKITEEKLSQILYFGNYQEYKKGTNKWVLEQPVIMAQDALIDGSLGHCFNGELDGRGSLNCISAWGSSDGINNSYEGDAGDKRTNDGKDRKTLYEAFFNAVQKSLNSSAKLAKELTYRIDEDWIMHVTQKDGKSDHLAYVFDIMLYTYYQYVGELYWIFSNSQTEEDPIEVCVKVINSQTDVNRKVWLAQLDGTKNMVSKEASGLTFGAKDTFSPMFAYAIKKRYGNNVSGNRYASKEMSQIKDFSGIVNADTSKCDEVKEISGGGTYIDDSLVGDNPTVVGRFNISKAVLWITEHSYNQYIKGKCGKCATAVLNALAAGGLTLPNGFRHTCGEKCGSGYATNLWYNCDEEEGKSGLLFDWGFSLFASGTTDANTRVFPRKESLQMGDVAIIGYNKNLSKFSSETYRYHACIWTGKEWISDFKQGDRMSPYKNFNGISGGCYPYAVFRYTKRD